MSISPTYMVPRRLLACLGVALLLCLTPLAAVRTTSADSASSEGFSLQVSPSPLIGTLKPGTTSMFDLQIRNTNSAAQSLKMGLRSFTINSTTGQVQLQTTAPPDVAGFVHFSSPTFTVQAGEIITQHITVATPASAGFTYSFAITVSQAAAAKTQGDKSAIQGTVAVFTLLSVDKPGATRKLELSKLSVSKHIYEYLPATISIKFKNTGNTLIQPKGTIFIQRKSDDKQPLASIQLNASGGFILPGTSRSLSASWNDGFPHYKTVTGNSGASAQKLSWSGSDISKLRFGRYVAKVVAVYDDGQHDVPINAEVSFWVIPWPMILIVVLIVGFFIVGAVTILRKSRTAIRMPRAKTKTKAKASDKQDA